MKGRMRYLFTMLSIILMALTVGCAATRTQESPGEYVDDSVITGKVQANLFNASDVKSGDIKIKTYRGVVQLSGFVNDQHQIDRAVEITRSTNGVKSVINDLHIKPRPEKSTS